MSVFDLIADLMESGGIEQASVTSGKTANSQPLETQEKDSKVVPMTPATPEPVSEAAIMKAMERACIGLPITPGEFRAAIDADEAGWCATGRIPIKTARAFARLFAGDLAKDPGHPINHHMVTCWGCAHYRGKFCLKHCAARDDKWLRCDGYQEATR